MTIEWGDGRVPKAAGCPAVARLLQRGALVAVLAPTKKTLPWGETMYIKLFYDFSIIIFKRVHDPRISL